VNSQIGINLGDPVFRGVYHGKKAHEDDLVAIISRARDVGVEKMMITGSSLKDSREAIKVAENHRSYECMDIQTLTSVAHLCYATVGIHPCSARTIPAQDPARKQHLLQLTTLAKSNPEVITAFGEFGLDYDRLNYASVEDQTKAFEEQLDMAINEKVNLPLFLHMRAAADDFIRLIGPRMEHFPKRGLVHSFTGTVEEMKRMVELGLDVGVNGCSLKTEENLLVVKEIPLERLQIETDGPWCEIRPSHAGHKHLKDADPLTRAVKKEKWAEGLMVKGRNEPAAIIHVAHIIAKVKGISVEEVAEA
jgi:TatD DNase family protein